jgi:predicted dienelactone hydrolase
MTWLAVCLFACNAGRDSNSDVEPDALTAASAPGAWNVGYTETSLTYDSPAGSRTLRVATWYPTDDATGTSTRYLGVFPADDVFLDAKLSGVGHPVAIFSHGHQGFPEYSSFLMRHFASHGWVVVAPEHTDDTTFDDADRKTEIYFERPLDVSATLDDLAGRTLDDLPLWDGSTVLGLGHSFGGYTVFALAGATYAIDDVLPTCADGTGPAEFCSTMSEDYAALFRGGFQDDRIAAVISMAPGDYGLFQGGLSTVDVPVLYMNGSLDPAAQHAPEFRAALSGERYVEIAGADHQSFTDFAGMLDNPPELIPPEDGFRIVDTYTLLFAQAVRGDAASEAALAESVDDRATLEE